MSKKYIFERGLVFKCHILNNEAGRPHHELGETRALARVRQQTRDGYPHLVQSQQLLIGLRLPRSRTGQILPATSSTRILCSHGQRCSRIHFNTSRCPPLAATHKPCIPWLEWNGIL